MEESKFIEISTNYGREIGSDKVKYDDEELDKVADRGRD